MNAKESELLNDNPSNHTNFLAASVYFNGDLSGIRLMIHDSPGVKTNNHAEHKNIA